MTERSGAVRAAGYAVLAGGAVAAAVALGQAATFPNLAPWYAALHKPAFNPPNWVFAPVWTTLYVLMAVAAWRILVLAKGRQGRGPALAAFALQLALNALWSWLFFAAHSPLLGLVDIIPQWLAVVATAVLFARLDRLAGWCLVPLALWVGFAGLLNFAVWRLN